MVSLLPSDGLLKTTDEGETASRIVAKALDAQGQARAELAVIAGPNPDRVAQFTLLAALWQPHLAQQFAPRVCGAFFADDLLRSAAAYSVGAVGTYGVNDPTTVRRLLLGRFAREPVELCLRIVERLAPYVDALDVDKALRRLKQRSIR